MLISIAQLAGGFILLVWGADRLVAGASALARNLGVSPLIIGLTIIAFGTSAPELVVSGVAAFRGNPSLAVGNAIGWLALAGSLGLLLLYLPGSPSALQWPVEWGLVLLWYLLGVIFYRMRAGPRISPRIRS